VELGWQASLGRFGLDWGLYFKELLGENVVTPSQNKQFSIVLRFFFIKKRVFAHNIIQFLENCVSRPPKKKTDQHSLNVVEQIERNHQQGSIS
jgi:hypothetical protein